jgi:TonB family protein
MKTEYQNLFERDRKRWVEACTREDPLGADSVRQEIRASDPTGDLGTAVLRQMRSCPASGCTELPSVQVLSKLRTRIYPKVDPALRPYESKLTVKVRIDDKGRVTVLDIDNPVGNRAVSEAVKGAVEQWKFDPALAAGSATRCVVTEFFLEFEK